jgi:hypothetical protein
MVVRILYLIHQTAIHHLPRILKSGILQSRLQAFQERKVQLPTGMSEGKMEKVSVEPGEYPGVYMSVVFSTMVGEPMEDFFDGQSATLVFCKTLLFRDDYHFNTFDSNGYLNDLTYGPGFWTQISFEDVNDKNEIIFHHAVPLLFLRHIWVSEEKQKDKVRRMIAKQWGQSSVPQHFVEVRTTYKNVELQCASTKLKMTKALPNFCFFPDIYERQGKAQSLQVAKKVAQNCGMPLEIVKSITTLEELNAAIYPYVQAAFLKQRPLYQAAPPFQ